MDIRVLMVGGTRLYRDGLAAALAGRANITTVGSADTLAPLMLDLKFLGTTVILLDGDLHGKDDPRCISEALCGPHELRLMVMLQDDRDPRIPAWITLGAHGLVLKRDSADDLAEALAVVAKGGVVLHPQIARTILEAYRCLGATDDSHGLSLTERELTVLKLLGSGKSQREIAEHLNVSRQTIHDSMVVIYKKLRVTNRTAAVLAALNRHLLH